MKHLVRAALLVVVLVAALLIVRQIKAPASLEAYGFYKGNPAANAQEWASRPMSYAAVPECSQCHGDRYDTWKNSAHSAVSCENCHGPAQDHIDYVTPLVVDTSRDLCGTCHAQLASRPKDFPQVDMATHGGQQPCVSCHDPHNPQIAAPPAIPHDLAGRSDCLICHGPGGLKPVPDDHAGRTSGTCLSCHTTKN